MLITFLQSMSRNYPLKVMWTDTLKWAMVAFISTGYRALYQFFSEAAKIVSPPGICDTIFGRVYLQWAHPLKAWVAMLDVRSPDHDTSAKGV